MKFAKIPLQEIEIDPGQPRKNFDQESLKQLADSIKEVGQLQPIIVSKKDDSFLLVAGERRYRAVKKNNKKGEIAAVILEEDTDEKQIQLIENLQREDLNALERAKSIVRYINENELSKKAASNKLGIPRTTLTEWLNILDVKPFYQQAVLDEDSSLTLSHISLAKGLASRTGDPSKLQDLLDGVLKYNFSSSETKEIVDLFHDYLHLSMEEAFDTILIKREQKKYDKKRQEFGREDDENDNSVNSLITIFDKVSNKLDNFMEKTGQIEDDEKRNHLISEFLYIYQALEIMIPELEESKIKDLIKKVRDENVEERNYSDIQSKNTDGFPDVL